MPLSVQNPAVKGFFEPTVMSRSGVVPPARLSALGVWRFGMMDLGASKSWRLKAELDWRRARVAADLD